MPFTPFHMGPALAVKSAIPRHFSVPIFGITQVGIDLEVLAGLFVNQDLSNHSVLHTFGGATAVALAALLLLRPVFNPIFRFWNRTVGAKPTTLWHMGTPIPWSTAILSAFFGSWSHALLDAMVHRNITPFAPFSDANWLFDAVWPPFIVPICIVAALIGGGVLFGRSFGQRENEGGEQSDVLKG